MTTNLKGLIPDEMITDEALAIEAMLEAHDFYPISTGGGCTAYERITRNREGIVVEEAYIVRESGDTVPTELSEGSTFTAKRPGNDPDIEEHGPLDKLVDRLAAAGVI